MGKLGQSVLHSVSHTLVSCRTLQVQDLFTETKQELEETTEKLTMTKGKLVQTKQTLRETKVNLKDTELDRDAHKYLASELKKSEDELYDTANSVSCQ